LGDNFLGDRNIQAEQERWGRKKAFLACKVRKRRRAKFSSKEKRERGQKILRQKEMDDKTFARIGNKVGNEKEDAVQSAIGWKER